MQASETPAIMFRPGLDPITTFRTTHTDSSSSGQQRWLKNTVSVNGFISAIAVNKSVLCSLEK